MVRVIINSDDLGYSIGTNEAIAEAFKLGLITSTTMLANFEEGFADAIKKIHAGIIPENAVGIHLNLTEGKPLSQSIKTLPRFVNKAGLFCFKRNGLKPFSKAEKGAVSEELEMQLNTILNKGIALTHIDSHHHVHTEPAVLPIALAVAKKYNIRKVRLSRNIGVMNPVKKVFKQLFNTSIHVRGFRTTRYFGDVADIKSAPPTLEKQTSIEVMVHALYNKNGILCDLDNQPLFSNIENVKAFLNSTSHIFSSYQDL